MLQGVTKTAGCMKTFIDDLLVKLKEIEETCAITKAAENDEKEFKINGATQKKKNSLYK